MRVFAKRLKNGKSWSERGIQAFIQLVVVLSDKHLQFEDAKGLNPLVQEMTMELAVEGQSYRSASHTLEKLLGYSVISNESIRQYLLQTEVI
ncbi:Uncharacterised protein family (UPF0236) [Sporosarcina pasteurii]|uniref:Transposase n=2 Tax=Sporosarcina pasteurii TaxID=1474 RepID=A0A380BMV3_SPOPA|nr:Uncharacterised protein family (UPF0236) [Sporosarcina pasteurii]